MEPKTTQVVAQASKDRTKKIVVPPEEVKRIADVVKTTFPDAPVMIMVLKSESSFDCGIKNPGSSARGCFQILTSTWKGAACTGDVYDIEDNIACARKLYDESGLAPWLESKNTWAPYTKATFEHVFHSLGI